MSSPGHSRRWPTPMVHDGQDYLTTAQVAKVLGVKPESVYAYVSRGRLASVRIDGVPGSLFSVAQVEALTGDNVRVRPPAGAVERIRTHITSLAGDQLRYRGRDVRELVDQDFLDVARILWDHDVPQQESLLPQDAGATVADLLGPSATRLDAVRVAVDLSGAADRLRYQRSGPEAAAKALRILDSAVGILPGGAAHTGATFAERLWHKLSPMAPTRPRVAVLNAALVLLADHDLAASTVAARVAASARASVYAVVAAGLGALDGPLHGGAATAAYRYLEAALADPEQAVSDSLRAGQPIPGTGHRVYTDHDPRADILLELAERAGGGDRRIAAALATISDAVAGTPAGFINSDLALAAVALRFRMPADAPETIFGLARIAGWVAHALEEYDEPLLRFRPEGVYVGKKLG